MIPAMPRMVPIPGGGGGVYVVVRPIASTPLMFAKRLSRMYAPSPGSRTLLGEGTGVAVPARTSDQEYVTVIRSWAFTSAPDPATPAIAATTSGTRAFKVEPPHPRSVKSVASRAARLAREFLTETYLKPSNLP